MRVFHGRQGGAVHHGDAQTRNGEAAGQDAADRPGTDNANI
jgi:hypothetical protein